MEAKGYDLGNGYRVVLSSSKLGEISMLFKDGEPIWTGDTAKLKDAVAKVSREKMN